MSEYLNINKSILKRLSNQEIEEVVEDYRLLHKEDYEFYFVIDADEVADYCHPFARDVERDLGEVSDEEFIMEYIFHMHREKVIFLQEYEEELEQTKWLLSSTVSEWHVKNTIEKYLETLVPLTRNLRKLIEGKSEKEEALNLKPHKQEEKKKKKEEEKKEDFLQEVIKAYSFLQSVSKGTYKNILEKHRLLMAAPISFEKKGIEDPVIAQRLKEYQPNTKLAQDLLDNYTSEQSKSRALDIKALLKTYYLTNRSKLEKENKLFFFVSSKTKDITSIKKEIITGKLDKSVFGDQKVKTLIRNKSQLFAYLVYDLMYKGEKVNINEVLSKFDKKSESMNLIYGEGGREKLLLNLIRERDRDEEREITENLAIHFQKRKEIRKNNQQDFFKIENFRKLIYHFEDKKEIDQLELSVTKVIKHAERYLRDTFGAKNENTTLGKIKDYIDIVNIGGRISRFIDDGLLENKENLKFDRGSDPIESIFSSFPILFYHTFFDEGIFELLKRANKENLPNSEELFQLTNFLEDDNSKIEILSLILYLLLIITYEDTERHYSSNFIVYLQAYELIQKQLNRNARVFDFPEEKLADIYSMGCWAARRSRKYKFAYILSQKGKKLYPKDPRFDFSLALNGYCWKYEYKTMKRYEWSYENYYEELGKCSILFHCENALKKFKAFDLFKENQPIHYFYCSLLNLTAFSYIVKYKRVYSRLDLTRKSIRVEVLSLPDVQEALVKSRQYVDEFKAKLKKIHFNDEYIYPEYLHTEAFLIYYEVLNTIYLKKDTKVNKNKIDLALKKIEKAITNCTERKGLKGRCTHLKKNLLRLKNQIET